MKRKPNILVIMSDQHHKRVMGCAGNNVIRTPNLDRLASEGCMFTNFYTSSPLCVPARMSFMTSRTPSRNRVWCNTHSLDPSIPTWAHYLGLAGYETALIGRMHFLGPDQRHGFEFRPCGEPRFAYHFGKVMKVFDEGIPKTTGQTRKIALTAGTGKGPYEIYDEQVTDATIAYIKEHAAGRTDKPFAAVTGFLLPHCPFIGDPDAFDYYLDRVEAEELTEDEISSFPESVKELLRSRDFDTPIPAEQVRAARAAYYAMVESVDKLTGRILQALEENGLAENTLLIYTSDHGEMMNEHGIWAKSCFYEGAAGVPMIARLPGRIPAGKEHSAVAGLMDIGPTLIELAEAAPPDDIDGNSLIPLLENKKQFQWKNQTVSELYEPKSGKASRMLRRGPWKIWKYSDRTPPVLFNMEEDPDEKNDLALDPNHEQIREELLDVLSSDWDYKNVKKISEQKCRDFHFMMKWGECFTPEHRDTSEILRGQQYFQNRSLFRKDK